MGEIVAGCASVLNVMRATPAAGIKGASEAVGAGRVLPGRGERMSVPAGCVLCRPWSLPTHMIPLWQAALQAHALGLAHTCACCCSCSHAISRCVVAHCAASCIAATCM